MDGKTAKPHAAMCLRSASSGLLNCYGHRSGSGSIALVAQTVTVAAALLVPGAPLLAQGHDVQQWTLLAAQGRINDNILVQAEVQPRLTDNASRLGQVQVSASLGYKFNKTITGVAGYTFAHSDPADGPAKDEHRLFQQIAYPIGKLGDTSFTARTRLEERVIVNSQDVVWRFRQQVRAQVPLTDGKGPVLVVWSEGFYNLNDGDWGARPGLDRWRNFLGVDVTIDNNVTLEPGVIEQVVFRKGKDHFDHIANITMTYRF